MMLPEMLHTVPDVPVLVHVPLPMLTVNAPEPVLSKEALAVMLYAPTVKLPPLALSLNPPLPAWRLFVRVYAPVA